jgi:multicomponent Na+:H+ antiporter subunit F
LPILAVSALLVFVRFFLGPSIADRVVAFDLLIVVGMGIIAIYSIFTDQPTVLDIAMIFALIAFLGTTAMSYYLRKSQRKGRQKDKKSPKQKSQTSHERN